MLEHLPCVRIDPAPFRPQPISNMDGRAIRFELERQACQSLRQVLQLKLQQRRTREELVNQGIMPPLKSSAAFHEQRRSLERARTEDYLKRKMKSRPEKSELIRMHILEDSAAEPLLQAKQLQLKRARLADDLNDKIAHRPGPMELIHKNILPLHSSIKQAIIETEFSKASRETSSCDEDSNASLSPGQPVSQECPLAVGREASPVDRVHVPAWNSEPSPTQAPLSTPPPLPTSASSVALKLTNGKTASCVQGMATNAHIKPKSNCDRSAQKHKKAKDNKPKVKKLKYHQYIPPDQKGDKEPPPHLDSSYAKILQQQQLFLQLQILSQQQQHYNYHTILPAPPKSQTDQAPTTCSSSTTSSSSSSSSSPPQSTAAVSTGVSVQRNPPCGSSVSLSGTKPASLLSNLDEMKVAELKCELKLRSLPLSGTKNDLIERLRTYQELNGGGDTTLLPTAGGTTGPGAEGAATSFRTAATSNTTKTAQPTSQCHQISLHTVSASLTAAAPQPLMTCGVTGAAPPAPLLGPSDHSPLSPEDGSFTSEPLGELMSSPLTQLHLETPSSAMLQTNIKEELPRSAPAPCQFSLKSSSLKRGPGSSAAHAVDTSALPVLIDKDRMLREKDRQIEELTRMLRQKEMLVDILRRQLEHGNREGRVSEPLILLRVKEEPPDKPGAAYSAGNPQAVSRGATNSPDADVTVKEEVVEEAREAPFNAAAQASDSETPRQPLDQTQKVQEQVHFKPEKKVEQQYVCLQQTALQIAQQQAIQKLLLQRQSMQQKQRQAVQSPNQLLVNPQNLQKLCQQKKKKSQKLQLKQQQGPKQLGQSQEQQSKHLQQMQLKQQILLKQQKSLLQQQLKVQQQSKQLQQIQIQTKIHMKKQQVPMQQKQVQQQAAQAPQMNPQQQQSGSAPTFPLELLKSDSTPTLVTDGNGNHFLIALTNHIAGNQSGEASEEKTAHDMTTQQPQSPPAELRPGQIPVQLTVADRKTRQSMHQGVVKQQSTETHNGGLLISEEEPQQEAAQCLSAPPTLQSFFRDPDTVPSEKNTPSPSSQTELCPSLDVLFSPLSPASVQTATSSPGDKDTEHEEDFIDIIMQTGGVRATADPLLHCLYPQSTPSPPSPLPQLLSPSCPPCCDSPLPDHPVDQPEPRAPALLLEEKRHLGRAGGGRLEDFLESATGKPLLGVEPGGLLTVIDDLNSQMLCTPSILDHPSSPMDTFDMMSERDQELENMDWLDFDTGREKEEETPTLAPLCPQTPPSVFSTDFLDSYDLYIHWDSSL